MNCNFYEEFTDYYPSRLRSYLQKYLRIFLTSRGFFENCDLVGNIQILTTINVPLCRVVLNSTDEREHVSKIII